MPQAPCVCLECRLRSALAGGEPGALFEINMNEAYTALGNVMGELLAHADTKTAKRFTSYLLTKRREWKDHPRVVTQHTVGNG